MKYLCLICAETVMEQMPEAAAEKHYEEYREFTEGIRKSGHRLCRGAAHRGGLTDTPRARGRNAGDLALVRRVRCRFRAAPFDYR